MSPLVVEHHSLGSEGGEGLPSHPLLADYVANGLPFWTYGGAAVVTDQGTALTPFGAPPSSSSGAAPRPSESVSFLWNQQPVLLSDWAVTFDVRARRPVSSADVEGVAFWYLVDPTQQATSSSDALPTASSFGVKKVFNGIGAVVRFSRGDHHDDGTDGGVLSLVRNDGRPPPEGDVPPSKGDPTSTLDMAYLKAISLCHCSVAWKQALIDVVGDASSIRRITVRYNSTRQAIIAEWGWVGANVNGAPHPPSAANASPPELCCLAPWQEVPLVGYFGFTGFAAWRGTSSPRLEAREEAAPRASRILVVSRIQTTVAGDLGSEEMIIGGDGDMAVPQHSTLIQEFDAALDRAARAFWSGRGDHFATGGAP